MTARDYVQDFESPIIDLATELAHDLLEELSSSRS